MKKILNKMLMTIFKFYRKKEDTDLAIFSSRVIIMVIVLFYCLDIHAFLTFNKLIDDIPLPHFKSRWTFFLFFLPLFVSAYLVVYLLSEKKSYFEEAEPSKQELSQGRLYFILFVAGSILGMVLQVAFR